MMRKVLLVAVTLVAVLGTGTAHAAPTLESIGIAKPKIVHKAPKKEEHKVPTQITYTVKAGDTLKSLSDSHSTTWERVWAKNPALSQPDVISVGETLIIPQNNEVLPDRLLPTPVAAAQTVTSAVSGSCGDNQYAQYIYQKESGCNLNAINSGGCRGIGQACPGSKLPCGADYACQNAFFTAYALSTYGGWEQAASFWQANGWW